MRISFLAGGALAMLQAAAALVVSDGWMALDAWKPPLIPSPGACPAAGSGAVSLAARPLLAEPPSRRPESPPQPHPFVAPVCPEVTLAAVSEAPDFEWSRATLRAPAAMGSRAVRFGAAVGSRRVVYVGHNPLRASPAVWLSDGPGLCQTVLRQPPATIPAARATSESSGPRAAARELTRLVARVDDDSFRIDRRLLHLALGDAKDIDPGLHGVRGRLTSEGFHFGRIPPGSLPAALGLEAGDRVVAFNGRPIAGPEGLVALYADLSRGAPATLTVARGHRTVRLDYSFD